MTQPSFISCTDTSSLPNLRTETKATFSFVSESNKCTFLMNSSTCEGVCAVDLLSRGGCWLWFCFSFLLLSSFIASRSLLVTLSTRWESWLVEYRQRDQTACFKKLAATLSSSFTSRIHMSPARSFSRLFVVLPAAPAPFLFFGSFLSSARHKTKNQKQP